MVETLGELIPFGSWPFINGCKSILRRLLFAGPPTKTIEEVFGILPTALTSGVSFVYETLSNCLAGLLGRLMPVS